MILFETYSVVAILVLSSDSACVVAVVVDDIEPLTVPLIVPVAVMLRKPVISLFVLTTTALDADTVPAVIPSMLSKSFSLISALPITKLPPVIVPVVVILDEPLSMLPKPDVMLPLFNAPVEVMLVVVIPSTYALMDC